MKIEILQLNWKKLEDREMRLTITCDGQIGAMFHALIDGKYDVVANVDTARHTPKDHSVEDALEIAFMLTQSLESNWIGNEGVEVTDAVREAGGARSSSVGDIFRIDNKYFAVAGCGFEELTLDKAREEAQAEAS